MGSHNADWPDGEVPREWVNPEVHRMRCIARIADKFGHFEADLVFINGAPWAVFEWTEYTLDNVSVPAEVVRLDPARLHPLPESWAPVRWMYELPLEDPRKLN